MGIFDIFTNDSAEKAADANRAAYSQYGTTANNALDQYGTTANGIYSNYGSTYSPILQNAYTAAKNDLTGGLSAANGYYGQGVDALNSGIAGYAPLSALGTKYGGATSLALDALGVNGADGTQRAQSAFTTSPGYDFEVNQATDSAARKAASLGIAGSGNTLDEIRNRAQGIAGQEYYKNWLPSLLGFTNPELSATAGAANGQAGLYQAMASLYGNQANLNNSNGQALAGIDTGLGNALTNLGGTVAGGQTGVAQNLAQGQLGIASNVAGGTASANNAEAQAAQNGSATFWNALATLGGNAAKAYKA